MKRTRAVPVLLVAIASMATGAYAEGRSLEDLIRGTTMPWKKVEGKTDLWWVEPDEFPGAYITYWEDDRKFAMIYSKVMDHEPGYQYSRDVLRRALAYCTNACTKLVLDQDEGDIYCQAEVYLPTLTSKVLDAHVLAVTDEAGAVELWLEGAEPLTAAPAPPLYYFPEVSSAPYLGDVLKATGSVYYGVEGKPDQWKLLSPRGAPVVTYIHYYDQKKRFAWIYGWALDRKDGYVYSREVLEKALKFNNDHAGVKLVLDEKDGDLRCQTELYVGTLTAESLRLHYELMDEARSLAKEELYPLAPDG